MTQVVPLPSLLPAVSAVSSTARPPLPTGFSLSAPRFVADPVLRASLLRLLEVSLPDEDPESLVSSVEFRPGGRFLLLHPLADPTSVAAAALLRRRRLGATYLLALATDPMLRSRGLGAYLLRLSTRLAPRGLDVDVDAPPLRTTAALLVDPWLRLPDPDARRLAFYLRFGAQVVSSIPDPSGSAPDDSAEEPLALWLPPGR